jgi:rod shape-determining protein MreC
VIILVLLLIYGLAQILSIGAQKRSQQNFLERVIIGITSPPQKLFTYFIDKFNDTRLHYFYLVDARKNYVDLLKSHRQLVLKAAALEEEHQENIRLRNLLGFKEEVKLEMVPARVISLGTSSFTHSLRIDKGSDDGIATSMAVVTADGVVGHVISSSSHYADVLLLPDPNSSVDVVDQETRSRGIVHGQDKDALRLEFVARNEEVQIGNRLVTSGLDGIYPKGLAVGTITEKRGDVANIFLEIIIKPMVTFSKLEEVLVITTRPNKEELMEIPFNSLTNTKTDNKESGEKQPREKRR